jgi:D-glycero-alpha-D-manno-heptose 1-phosphate guanylyltransferase
MKAGTLAQCPVLILAGGLGTRLRTKFADGPKVLAPVGGRPFLSYLLNHLVVSGFREIILCVGYRAEDVERWLGNGSALGLSVNYSREDEPMGTAGALRLAYQRFAEDKAFFAMNGDSILQVPFAAMYKAHLSRRPAATVALAEMTDTSRYGSVDVDENGFVSGFREKSGERVPGLINAGIYFFEPLVMNLVPPRRSVSLEREILPQLVSRGLLAFKSDGFFIDIGVPEDLARAQAALPEWVRS